MRRRDVRRGLAFVYSDCRVFGKRQYVDTLPEYNLYNLLDRNFLTYAALIRKNDWELAGGYDESMRLGYEDWEFWLRLGAGEPLWAPGFRNRCFVTGRGKGSLYDVALAHDAEIVAYMQGKHPELYDDRHRARLKALSAPAVCFTGPRPAEPQTIEDVCFTPAEAAPPSGAAEAPALLAPASSGFEDPQSRANSRLWPSGPGANRYGCRTVRWPCPGSMPRNTNIASSEAPGWTTARRRGPHPAESGIGIPSIATSPMRNSCPGTRGYSTRCGPRCG